MTDEEILQELDNYLENQFNEVVQLHLKFIRKEISFKEMESKADEYNKAGLERISTALKQAREDQDRQWRERIEERRNIVDDKGNRQATDIWINDLLNN